MAKLVSVCRTDDCRIERRQMPIFVEENLKMVVQFPDICMGCDTSIPNGKDVDRFVKKILILNKEEMASALMVHVETIYNQLSYHLSCVGCRRSVERLYTQLAESGHPSLEPVIILKNSVLSVKSDLVLNFRALYALFYIHGSKLPLILDSIPKSKKNKRCNLHSLDTHKAKPFGFSIDVKQHWDLLSEECREEVLLIDNEGLGVTLEVYLCKHRFCSECKSKVLFAFSLLFKDEKTCRAEKGFCPELFAGIRCCYEDQHIHVPADLDTVTRLINRAQPDMPGRERHAKTLEVAQEEVLTCLGIHLAERLHRICQKLRSEEQTWQILFYLGVETLKKSLELAVEQKQGVSNLELTCREILNEELAIEQRRLQKRLKRRKKKSRHQASGSPPVDKCAKADSSDVESSEAKCQCGKKSPVNGCHKSSCRCDCCELTTNKNNNTTNKCDQCIVKQTTENGSKSSRKNCHRSKRNTSPTNTKILDGFLMESSTNGDNASCLCSSVNERQNTSGFDYTCGCLENGEKTVKNQLNGLGHSYCDRSSIDLISKSKVKNDALYGCPSLQDMLESAGQDSEEDGYIISEEEIRKFRENSRNLNSKRQELREVLRQRFATLKSEQPKIWLSTGSCVAK